MGLQFTWSVEMAYGTPFLLQLGLSKSLMSLVWLAGPLSGLVMQPVVGVLSDRCTFRLGRRRPFLIIGVGSVVLTFLSLGWCREIMRELLGADNPKLHDATILMAVASIYILDFAINCVQASCRTLIVDSLPSSQQEAAAAWASRLMGLGGIFGYFMGNINLPELIPAFGDTQIKGLCVTACLFLLLSVGLTCFTVTERFFVRPPTESTSKTSEFLQGFRSILRAIQYLPTRIQYLCNVQFFAWMGWFPFLFYSSTYIAEIYTIEQYQKGTPIDRPEDGSDPTTGVQDAAVRAGSFCLLIYSVVSLVASILLPVFVEPDVQLLSSDTEVISQQMQEDTHQERTHGRDVRNDRHSHEGVEQEEENELLFHKEDDDDEHGTEEIRMTESHRGQKYHPVKSRESLEVVVTETNIRNDISSLEVNGNGTKAEGSFTLGSRLGSAKEARTGRGEDPLASVGRDQVFSDPSSDTDFSSEHKTSNYDPSRLDEQDEEAGMATTRLVDYFNNSKSNNQFTSRRISSYHRESGLSAPNQRSNHARHHIHYRGDIHDNHDYTHQHPPTTSSLLPSSTLSPSSLPSSSPSPAASGSLGQDNSTTVEATSAGALLGIHNVYIVLPQFLVSFLSSVIFAAIEPKSVDTTTSNQDASGGNHQDSNVADPQTIGVMLRFGGLMAAVAALLSLRLWKKHL
ncbi:hypothetical protein BGW38_001620 [Lunasporangiospora selenospora]|uniref:MFS general substrate transporter n=1 Tax=Lunasporangiospora selenospora TaxID=979761 RepID=A0A9P6G1M5_9FUNG|nr:hypothetical protein BGW38_001620 [Lunasporangiospora selenospora]